MAMTIEVTENGFIFHGSDPKITGAKNALLFPFGKMMHYYGLKLCLCPSSDEEQQMKRTIGCSRVVGNDYLETRGKLYKEEKKTLSVYAYKKEYLPKLKDEKPYLREVDKYAMETACENVDAAFRNFYEGRAKYPKMKSRRKPSGNRYTTRYTNNNIKLEGYEAGGAVTYTISLPRVGKVPFVLPREMEFGSILPPGAKISKVTVSHECDGKWYASLTVETVIDLIHPVKTVEAPDILSGDLGIKDFLILGGIEGESEHIPNPHFIKVHARRLRLAQKKLSRRKYDKETHTGSFNWEKARLLVAKEQKKTANQRKDFHHKESTKIAKRCTYYLSEDLNVRGMMKNRHLSKAIASVGWSQFLTFLDYKLKRKGGGVIKIPRFYPSSQMCGHCGHKNPAVKNLGVREWTCPFCGKHHDRDGNAQKNVWMEGARTMLSQGFVIRGVDVSGFAVPVS